MQLVNPHTGKPVTVSSKEAADRLRRAGFTEPVKPVPKRTRKAPAKE